MSNATARVAPEGADTPAALPSLPYWRAMEKAMEQDRKTAFARKYLDPRWQKKRLLILERDGWTCQQCQLGTETLHVHHLWYARDRDPWDYDDSALLTLCESCHEAETAASRDVNERLVASFRALNPIAMSATHLVDILSEVHQTLGRPLTFAENEKLISAVLGWATEVSGIYDFGGTIE